MSKFENDSVYKDKFLCINWKYVWKSLDSHEFKTLHTLLEKIKKENNLQDHNYLVVNEDEPYASKVWEIIKENERKQIVCFIGRAGSGKDYQCKILEKEGFVHLAFANALRDIAFTSLNLNEEQRNPNNYDWMKNNDCLTVEYSNKGLIKNHKLTFRKFLEFLGTQGIKKYDNDFWCKCLINVLKQNDYNKICISDMRFFNEYNYLKKFSEENEYDFKVIFCDYHSDKYQENNTHQSAKMGNWFATHGYTDLQEITEDDFKKMGTED